ncbi:Crp/Fnr family transcriptional regulator [Methylobacterium sp. SI9]|uniref:Crp/Fnr family transcriptional regulator n=1 Tax=Methylobacterium guangdongense TaxID=3138811 RepID=UPI00313E220F
MAEALIAKLRQFTPISARDERALRELSSGHARLYEAGAEIVREGDALEAVRIVLSGWACRYKRLPDGRYQAIGLLLPGDVCTHGVGVVATMDYAIEALGAVTVIEIAPAAFAALLDGSPTLARAFACEEQQCAALQREWALNLGRRDARERLLHLFSELFHRLHDIGLTQDNSYDCPLKQEMLADVIGMTSVHVNRVLQALRREKLIELRGRQLTILDRLALERMAQFNPSYLRLGSVDAGSGID